MKNLENLINEMKDIDLGASGSSIVFEKLLEEVVNIRTPMYIVPLLTLLNDESVYDELMFSIIHGIEVFDDEVYVSEVLRDAVNLCKKSPRWASIIFMRMLNSESTRLELIKQLRHADPLVRLSVKDLIEKIADRSVQFLPKAIAVLLAAS